MVIGFDPVPVGRLSGNSSYAINLVRSLSSLYPEHEYRFLSIWSGRNKKTSLETFKGLPNVQCMPVLPHPLLLGKVFEKNVRSLSNTVTRLLSSSFDLYHCTDPILFVKGMRRMVITIHDVHALFDQPWASPYEKSFYRTHLPAMIADARIVFCDSHCTLNDILHNCPAAEKKARVVPLAASPAFYPQTIDRSFLKKYGITDPQQPFLLAVGVFPPRKNTLRLLRAYANLPPVIQKEMHVLLIGHTGIKAEMDAIADVINQCHIHKRVTVLSTVGIEDLAKFYNTAHCLVFPSLYEGFGLPVIEAMACGCPVIASNQSSLPEVCGNAVQYVDPYNVESITEALQLVIGDSTLYKRLRSASLLRNSEFSWKFTATKTFEGYSEALQA